MVSIAGITPAISLIRSGSCWNCPPTQGSAGNGQFTIKYNKQNYKSHK